MQVVRTVLELREMRGVVARRRWAAMGRRPVVGLVPTMGALHAGHAGLLGYLVQDCDVSIVSIFVNPRQFDDNADLESYPRPLEADLALCQEHGVDIVFAPPVEEMYPEGFQTSLRTGAVGLRWEGEARPGHFDGVATVVAKLLHAATPDVAYFGEKDLQQLRVIEHLVLDLDLDMIVLPCPTVREADGLAYSSRNTRMSAQQRQFAPRIYQALQTVAAAFAAGETSCQQLVARGGHILQGWEQDGLHVDYFAIVDPRTLEPRQDAAAGDRAIIAVRLGDVRLIDNIELS